LIQLIGDIPVIGSGNGPAQRPAGSQGSRFRQCPAQIQAVRDRARSGRAPGGPAPAPAPCAMETRSHMISSEQATLAARSGIVRSSQHWALLAPVVTVPAATQPTDNTGGERCRGAGRARPRDYHGRVAIWLVVLHPVCELEPDRCLIVLEDRPQASAGPAPILIFQRDRG
jgi:hypothetical protein